MRDQRRRNLSGRQSRLQRQELTEAVDVANVPVLLMVLVHLTGELRWLQQPYLPSRSKGMDDHDTGGLPRDVQREIRAATIEAVIAAEQGDRALQRPDLALLERMLSSCMGEPVTEAYAQMMYHEMGFVDPESATRRPERRPADGRTPSVLVVGAGVSGICAAVRLKEAGYEFDVVEKCERVGGTWAANRYPGAGVDTPSHLYSYSFAPHAWPTYFAKRGHVEDYLRRVVDELDLASSIRLGVEVEKLRYDDASKSWLATIRDATLRAQTWRYDVVITAVGQLNRPKVPDLAGMDTFAGQAFHSSQWPADLDVRGRRVAIVGTGASAMQIVPAIARDVAQLSVFQRSPQWAINNTNYFRAVSEATQFLHDNVPLYSLWYRARLAWVYNDRVHASLQRDPDWPDSSRSINAANDGHRRLFTDYIDAELGSRSDLRRSVLPDYPPFGKRMLIDNGWFGALQLPNVSLITAGVERVTRHGVIDDTGVEHRCDVLVLATGFRAQQLLAPLHIIGRDGRTIREEWGDDDPRAYLGLMAPGFPNLFTLYGPNSNLGHGGSWITIAEAQVHYILQILGELSAGCAVEVREDAHKAYNDEVDRRHEGMIWSHPGMDTWYRNARGRVVTNSPWQIAEYWRMTRDPDWSHLTLTEPGADTPARSTAAQALP